MPHNLKTSASFSFHGGQQQPRCGPVPVAMQWFMTSSNAWCEAVAPHCNMLLYFTVQKERQPAQTPRRSTSMVMV